MAKHTSTTYGNLIRIDPENAAAPEILHRVPLAASTAHGGLAESDIHDLLFRFPNTLPIAEIDDSYANPVPVCCELSTRAGYVDALYVNRLGRLTLAEFKLWRNPQARREVIGQILDYAKELASWRYADLQREVSRALGKKGNVLYELVRGPGPGTNEADFVDNVTRHLQRGEFLLLIVGDGIREDVEDIVSFVQRHSGLHFILALVEAALYRDRESRIIVQPRVLARTQIVRREVVDLGVNHETRGDEESPNEAPSDQEKENLRFWTAVLQDYFFSDVDVEVPTPSKGPSVWMRVSGSGHGGWGLSFAGSTLRNRRPEICCFLTCRKDIEDAVRIFEAVRSSIEDLRGELGDDVESRTSPSGSPRIGFWRETAFPLPGDNDSDEFREAVSWMRDHLDRLVSTLHPRLRRMIEET